MMVNGSSFMIGNIAPYIESYYPECKDQRLEIWRFYTSTLVHGDFSEYNIFKTTNGLIVFDLGSAVDLRHPNSTGFLKRDISNITKFFNKRGIQVEDPETLFEEITK